ncbi:hypothetical protein E5D57_004758 [Metarhizium anisopliae]|nr:hypothetical protein E5D57_004758 [Metarhizium anisopliae]
MPNSVERIELPQQGKRGSRSLLDRAHVPGGVLAVNTKRTDDATIWGLGSSSAPTSAKSV